MSELSLYEETMKPIKVLVIGDAGVGKGTLIRNTIDYATSLDTDNRIEAFRNSSKFFFPYNAQKYKIQITHNKDREVLKSLVGVDYKGTKVVVICFSLTDYTTLDSVRQYWLKEVKKYLPTKPILLIGLKSEQRKETNQNHVTVRQGTEFRDEIKAAMYQEYVMQNSGFVIKPIIDIYETRQAEKLLRKSIFEFCLPCTTKKESE